MSQCFAGLQAAAGNTNNTTSSTTHREWIVITHLLKCNYICLLSHTHTHLRDSKSLSSKSLSEGVCSVVTFCKIKHSWDFYPFCWNKKHLSYQTELIWTSELVSLFRPHGCMKLFLQGKKVHPFQDNSCNQPDRFWWTPVFGIGTHG